MFNPSVLMYLGAAAWSSMLTSVNPVTQPTTVLGLMGHAPDLVASAGVTSSETSVFIASISEEEQLRADLHICSAAHRKALALDLTYTDALRQDPTGDKLRLAWQTNQDEISILHIKHGEILSDLASAMSKALGAKSTKLGTIQFNGGWNVPAEFWALELSDAEWITLEEAVIAESRAKQLGEKLSPETEKMLAELRAKPEVAAAKKGLDDNLKLIEQVWPK